MTNTYRKLTRKEIMAIQDIWRAKFQEKSKPQVNSPEFWYETILDFLAARGDEVVSKELIEAEYCVIELGKSKEYLSALMTVVDAASLDEADKAIVLLTASPEDRDAALKKIKL